jgi:hypothetical protein
MLVLLLLSGVGKYQQWYVGEARQHSQTSGTPP